MNGAVASGSHVLASSAYRCSLVFSDLTSAVVSPGYRPLTVRFGWPVGDVRLVPGASGVESC